MRVRLTQRELMFGVYRGAKGSLNPGLSIWYAGRYIWPWVRKHKKREVKAPVLPFNEAQQNQ